MWYHLFMRQTGSIRPITLRNKEEERRTYSIHNSDKIIQPNHSGASINTLAFDSSEYKYLISGSGDGSINIFDLERTISLNGPKQFDPILVINSQKNSSAHQKAVTSVQWYSHDTGMFFSSSINSEVFAWDTNSEKVVRDFKIDGKVYQISFSLCASSHNLLAVASSNTRLTLCDVRSGQALWQLIGHKGGIYTTQWSPGEEYIIASGGIDGTVRLWDIRKPGPCITMFDHNRTSVEKVSKKQANKFQNESTKPVIHKAHEGEVTSIVFTPDSHNILSTGKDHRIRLWNAHTGVHEIVNFSGTMNASQVMGNYMAVSNNGKLVYHPNGSDILVFEVKTGHLVHTLKYHFQRVNVCCFHTSIEELYSGGNDGQLNVWSPLMDCESSEDEKMENNEDAWSESEEK